MKTVTKNVAALDKVLALATQVGDSYKPSNASIERTALAALLEESRKSVTAVLKAEGNLATAINQRQQTFEDLPSLGVRIMGVAESGGMNKKDLQDLDKMRKRFRSQPFKNAAANTPLRSGSNAQGPEPSPDTGLRKNRQLGYDNKVMTLESIVKFLEEKPVYNPAEPELTVAGLKAKLADLQAKNESVTKERSTLVKVRGEAKSMVFDRDNGVYGKARLAKKYLKTILSRDSDLFKSVSKVKIANKA
jgi:hypothetical protein